MAYYLKEMKDVIKDEDPNLRMCDIVSIVAERWRNLEPTQKIKYQDKARDNQKVYQMNIKKQAEAPVKKRKLTNDSAKVLTNKERKQETTQYRELDNVSCPDLTFSDLTLSKTEGDAQQVQSINEETCSPNSSEVQKMNMLNLLDMYNKVETLRQMIIRQIEEIAKPKF